MVANTDVPIPNRPIAARLGEALHAGGQILIFLLLGVVHLWGVILLAVFGYIIWKWLRKRKRLIVAAETQKS